MNRLKDLQIIAKGLSILYVEDNNALRTNAAKLLKKFFKSVHLAENGEVALAMFKKYHYPLIITDIKMPKMDGITLLKKIKEIDSETKAIVMSAYDDKNLLLQGIELGVFRYLKKPVNVTELSNVLYELVTQILHEQNKNIFHTYLKNIFDYQSSMIIMIHNSDILLANDMFLHFFHYKSTQECRENIHDLSTLFLEHDGFLYNNDDINVLDVLKENKDKLFHVKLRNFNNDEKHFIVKYHEVPEKPEYGILSFEDVTELDLLELFDAKSHDTEESITNQKELFHLLELIKRNSAKVELHNFYKGLSITNNGLITKIENSKVTFKTSYIQQKAIHLEQELLIISNTLPFTIKATKIIAINFEEQTVEVENLKFVKTSPVTRKTLRVTVESKHSVTLFLEDNKFVNDIKIEDISLDAVKLKLNALPAGLEINSLVKLDIVIELNKQSVNITAEAVLYRKSESKQNFSLVFIFQKVQKSILVKYITKRQMELIREIKGVTNE